MVNKVKLILMRILCVITVSALFSCSDDDIVNSSGETETTINFSVGQKAVYAIARYTTNNDSTWMDLLEIFSIEFDSSYIANDTTYFEGDVEYFVPESFAEQYGFEGPILAADRIKVSSDDNWILYQSGSNLGSYRIFLKQNATNNDTILTQTPSEFFQRAPVFPRVIKSNTEYSILRPGNNDNFLPLYREFKFKNIIELNDEFGSSSGVEFEVKHFVASLSFSLDFSGVIDESGILISKNITEVYITSPENPDGSNKVLITEINRRITDYTDPAQVNPLPIYADMVLEKGFNSVIN